MKKNLDDNRQDCDRLEFVLVDIGSDEDITDWVIANFRSELESGYLKYFRTHKTENWHAPVAKNTSHRLSSGKILVNLDGDNFTGYRGGMYIYNEFIAHKHDICLWQFSGTFNDGSFGRIAAARDTFMAVGGYNEELLEMGYQDRDLVRRLESYGAKVVLAPDEDYSQAIPNEKYEPENMGYMAMRLFNRYVAKRLMTRGCFIANNGKIGFENVNRLTPKEGTFIFEDVRS
ncbi:MAG: hypothetical protein GY816_01855 [Cytophagales bacterium]|nr:hypothetical protein [Cytophagales bacterium]